MKTPRFPGLCAAPAIFTRLSRQSGAFSRCKTFAMGPQVAVSLANEADSEAQLLGVANELDLAAGDGWAQIAPYGTWPHTEGLQIFERADAEQIVSRFKSVWGRIKRAVVGLPLYKGHPDHKAFANTHTDKTQYGQWSDLEARDDGLWGRPVISAAGADLIEGGLRYLSPNWRAAMTGLANGRPVYRPRILDSVGLTACPNIPGHSLTNETQNPETGTQNRTTIVDLQKLITLLALANTATEADVAAAITALAARPETAALANEQSARTAAETKATEATAKLEAAETALANERTAHAATVKARNAALVDAAVRSGRIAEAARPTWEARLERDFAGESVALANEKSGPKTEGRTGDLGARKPTAATAAQFTALVNERMAAKGESWDAAWAATKATPEGKSLYEQMQAKA